MDPIGMIIAAIVTGVSTGLGDTIKADVEAAYRTLRDRIVERFSESKWVRRSLERVEGQPSSRNQDELREALESEGEIHQDDDLVRLAEGVRQASRLTAQQMINAAESAKVSHSPQSLDHLKAGETADIKQEIAAGRDAVVEDSGQHISFADTPRNSHDGRS